MNNSLINEEINGYGYTKTRNQLMPESTGHSTQHNPDKISDILSNLKPAVMQWMVTSKIVLEQEMLREKIVELEESEEDKDKDNNDLNSNNSDIGSEASDKETKDKNPFELNEDLLEQIAEMHSDDDSDDRGDTDNSEGSEMPYGGNFGLCGMDDAVEGAECDDLGMNDCTDDIADYTYDCGNDGDDLDMIMDMEMAEAADVDY